MAALILVPQARRDVDGSGGRLSTGGLLPWATAVAVINLLICVTVVVIIVLVLSVGTTSNSVGSSVSGLR